MDARRAWRQSHRQFCGAPALMKEIIHSRSHLPILPSPPLSLSPPLPNRKKKKTQMRAYYFDNLPGDQRLPHDFNPSRPVDPDTLQSIKVESWYIPVEGHEDKLDGVAKERDYRNRDVIEISKKGLGDIYDEKLKGFYKEHIHEDEEIRYILQGGGFFDVRRMSLPLLFFRITHNAYTLFAEAPSDQWIRLAVSAGDLLVIPAGIYHRFTVDERNLTRTVRLFKDEPKWSAIYRGTESESNPHRIEYIKSISVAA
ncbi:hypothetical protein D9757_009731 [Collybiopsis confluens]|uniref:Acireductone dioxygenase n=1 Tax=Collybiopsis confluens TaxID=2823264 RepID=A0A8H5H6C7_9AGAR|nr:hypothetical protein D9757_009731 [Collybiopsis confluens]